jgi:predicted nucleic acid-binding protein
VAILVDTSAIVALVDAADDDHQEVARYVLNTEDVLLVPVTVLPEADFLIAERVGVRGELALLQDIVAGGFGLESVTVADVARSAELIDQFADSDIGFVDASIVAVAERLAITRILTLNRRHFGVLRPRHCSYFTLVPS